MISKRNYRRQPPIEDLRQFSLNSSKGVDCSRPITDPSTLYDIDNLSINTDGSLSLRKPISVRTGIPITVSYGAKTLRQTHDPKLWVAIYDDCVKLYNESFEQVSFRVEYTYYYSDETGEYVHNVLPSSNDVIKTSGDGTPLEFSLTFDVADAEVTVLGTATLLTNIKVNSSSREGLNNFLPASSSAYRYLQIFKDPKKGTPKDKTTNYTTDWVVKIVNPEMNVINTSEEDFSIDINLLLDNPYALRDRFDCAHPYVRGLAYYGNSTLLEDRVVKTPLDKVPEHNLWELTESTYKEAYRIQTSVCHPSSSDVIRAFVDIPNSSAYYAAWFAIYDSKYIECVTPHISGYTSTVKEPEGSEFENVSNVKYTRLSYINGMDNGIYDILDAVAFDSDGKSKLPIVIPAKSAPSYVFKVVTLKNPKQTDDGLVHEIDTEYSRGVLEVPRGASDEFAYTSMPNASRGKKLYRNSTIFTYGIPELKNNILATYPGEFTTPIVNTITSSETAGEYITALIPWREYLVSATQSDINLHINDGGWYTKTINTATGIPESDSRCCVAVLNGVMFKSGSKIYQLYPNVYSGTDTILNVTELSKPVEELLLRHSGDGSQFAFSTESEYVLMLPDNDEEVTYCLRYDYTYKRWTHCTYPIVFYDYRINTIEDIRLYGHQKVYHVEYYFDKAPQTVDYATPYCDVLFAFDDKGAPTTINEPIKFLYDTGQKTDSLVITKQFVETKIVFATLNEEDSFPFTLHIAVDGDPHVTRKDVHTDAPFWKTEDNLSRGVAGTAFRLTTKSDSPASGTFNTLRQMIVRYSGKGKSIRHVIEGSSLYNFKMYETYVRYRNLNVKQ